MTWERLHDLIEEALYAALPKLKLHAGIKVRCRSRRDLGAILLSAMPDVITLAVESISSFIKKKQEHRMNEAVVAMREDQASIRNRLQQYANDFLSYGKYNVETLDEVIDTVNALHQRQTEMEALFSRSDMTFSSQSISGQMLDAMSFNFDLQLYLTLTEEEHVNQYSLLEIASKDLLRGIATLGQGRQPQELFPDQRLNALLKEVKTMVKKQYPDYILATDHTSHYRDRKLVTFAVDRVVHSIIVSFPVFIKDYHQPSLVMYEIESVPIPDKKIQR